MSRPTQVIFNNVSGTGAIKNFTINGEGELACEITVTGTIKLRVFLRSQDKFVEFDEFTATGTKTKLSNTPMRMQAEVTVNAGNITLEVEDSKSKTS